MHTQKLMGRRMLYSVYNGCRSGFNGRYHGVVHGCSGIAVSSSEPFTLYAELTEENVIGWVHTSMSSESAATYKERVDTMIANQHTPPVVTTTLF
jgi:Icc-related predicted phosphoesterase